MRDASAALQPALVTWLKAQTAITALVSTRIYDQVPANVVFPYLSLGPDDAHDWQAACLDGSQVHLQIDIWSRAVGVIECKRVKSIVATLLSDIGPGDLNTAGFLVSGVFVERTPTMRDPDGLTTHGIIALRADCQSI